MSLGNLPSDQFAALIFVLGGNAEQLVSQWSPAPKSAVKLPPA